MGISGSFECFSEKDPLNSLKSSHFLGAFTLSVSHLPAVIAFITARNSSCGKVMFSQVCVKNSVHSGCVYPMHFPPARTPLGTYNLQPCMPRALRDAVNERVVRIVLECILVCILFTLFGSVHYSNGISLMEPVVSGFSVLSAFSSSFTALLKPMGLDLSILFDPYLSGLKWASKSDK